MFKVVMCSMALKRDTGITGSFEECQSWCEDMGWIACPYGGFEWALEIEEV